MSSRSLGLFAGFLVSHGMSQPSSCFLISSGSSVRNRMRPCRRTRSGRFSTGRFLRESVTGYPRQYPLFYRSVALVTDNPDRPALACAAMATQTIAAPVSDRVFSGQYVRRGIVLKTVVTHTITYFFAGMTAYFVFDYATLMSHPPLSAWIRPLNHPMIMAG